LELYVLSIPNEELLTTLMEKEEFLLRMTYTRNLLEDLLNDVADANAILDGIAKETALAPAVNILMEKVGILNKKNAHIIKLKMVLKESNGATAEISRLTAIISQGEQTLKEKLGIVCPLCGSYLGKE